MPRGKGQVEEGEPPSEEWSERWGEAEPCYRVEGGVPCAQCCQKVKEVSGQTRKRTKEAIACPALPAKVTPAFHCLSAPL